MRFLKDVRTKHPKGRIISMSELTRDLVQEEKALLSKDSDSKYFVVFRIYRDYSNFPFSKIQFAVRKWRTYVLKKY